MEIKKCILTKNDCYAKQHLKVKPQGIVVHSTGANNPNLKRYVQPDDGLLGINVNNNSWNRSGVLKCVHAFIGKDKNGDVRVYQTLPYDYACWGCGSGKKGSYNHNPAYIQFEICEDNLKNEDYFNKCFDLAAEYCAFLIKEYKISINNVISHHESYLRGYGTNHSDCDHWLKKFGKDMDWFRNEVSKKLNNEVPVPVKDNWTTGNYKLLVAKCIRKQPNLGNNIVKVGNCTAITKKVLTSTKSSANAKIKVGTTVTITKIIKEGNRVWGKYGNCYIVLCNVDGSPQAKKVG